MKMNKKGFTLIEMLVVIAIIAVLVSIVIPVVSSSTKKAAAAANAANLRSVIAEATTDYLAGVDDDTGMVQYTASPKTFAARPGAPTAKAVDGITGGDLTISIDSTTGLITASFGTDGTLEAYRAIAEGTTSTK